MTSPPAPESDRGGNGTYVEYCLANVTAERRETLEDADLRTRGVACLDRCGRCYRAEFLVADGTPIEGEDCDGLLEEHRESEQV